ncbi:hypothetical protein Baya_13504 [Bagarius yarrelli]|uniref:Uncharacterized protein n=1 Tax=Bagarius yarrelli TaxID=175774 RepID=A0A556V678_BAGYA|nr:hypothetical protein Baya_13504 [Bagarius yarrelli]
MVEKENESSSPTCGRQQIVRRRHYSALDFCSDNFSLGTGIKLIASGFAHHQTCHSSRCQVIASQHSPPGHVTQKIAGQDKRMLNLGDSECSKQCVQGRFQWKLKEITASPHCTQLTHGTLSAPVHCGRLISAKKRGLQAALYSDGCFSAPGTSGASEWTRGMGRVALNGRVEKAMALNGRVEESEALNGRVEKAMKATRH